MFETFPNPNEILQRHLCLRFLTTSLSIIPGYSGGISLTIYYHHASPVSFHSEDSSSWKTFFLFLFKHSRGLYIQWVYIFWELLWILEGDLGIQAYSTRGYNLKVDCLYDPGGSTGLKSNTTNRPTKYLEFAVIYHDELLWSLFQMFFFEVQAIFLKYNY